MVSIKDLSLDDKECDIPINDLPDDILIRILSLLTLKEAGRTSVLSTRWRHVWAYVPSLKFDPSSIIQAWLRQTKQDRRDVDFKYVRWVDQVLSSHKAHSIEEFYVSCLLDENRKDTIDNWLRFAMEKSVKRLGLSVLPHGYRGQAVYFYKFPSSSSWNQLTSLSLAYVEVSGEFFENFLCDCQTLKSLSVFSSGSLVDSKIVGPLSLKSLEILHCSNLKDLEISAPNLLYFQYSGPQLLSWPLTSTPKIVEVVIQDKYADYLISDSSHLPSRVSQIEALTIKTQFRVQGITEVFPVFPRLKMLSIYITPVSVEPLFGLSSLILACPVLHKLVLRLKLTVETITMAASRRSINAKSFSHNHLKILEISGFSGSEQEVQLVEYLIESAVSLEKLIIKAGVHEGPGIDFFIQGREAAKLLFGNLKPGIEMEVRDEFDEHLWTARKA